MRRSLNPLASNSLESARQARKPLGRMLSRGRKRAAEIAETIADDVPEMVDDLAEVVEEFRREAAPRVAPLVDRAMGRRPSHRKRNTLLAVLGLAVVATVVYWFWQRRDMEPAYLVEEPDRPNMTPASGSPAPAAPAAPGPWGTGDGHDSHTPSHEGERSASAQATTALPH